MTSAQNKIIISTLRGLFPSATPEQLALVAEKIAGLEFGAVLAVVKNHGLAHVFLSLPALMEGLRTIAVRADQRRVEQQGRAVDWIRRHLTQRGDDSHVEHPDDEIVERYYAGCWRAVRDDPAVNPYGLEWARQLIFSHARQAAIGAGALIADAMMIAESAVELPSGGMIELPNNKHAGNLVAE